MKQFSLIGGVDSSFFYPMHPPRHCFHCCSLNPGGGSFFFLGFFFKGGESTDLVSCSWTLFLSRLDPTRVQVMMSPLLSWLWDTTLNESRGDFITWTLVGSSLDKKRVHEQETKSVDSPPLKKKPRKKNEPPGWKPDILAIRPRGKSVPTPGVEPGPPGWKPDILAVRPRGTHVFARARTGDLLWVGQMW